MGISRSEIERAFKAWVEKPVPSLVQALSDDHGYLIVEIFRVEKRASGLIGTDAVRVDTSYDFGVGKVLAVGSRWRGCDVKVGGLVRLRDMDTKTVDNPRYEAWVNNPYKRNLEMEANKVGEAPPPTMSNLYESLGRKIIYLDPFETDFRAMDDTVFFLDEGNVVCGVRDWKLWITGAETEAVNAVVQVSKTKALA